MSGREGTAAAEMFLYPRLVGNKICAESLFVEKQNRAVVLWELSSVMALRLVTLNE